MITKAQNIKIAPPPLKTQNSLPPFKTVFRVSVDTILLQRRESVENGPHFLLPSASLMDLLYSTDKVDFENILKQKEMNHATALKMKEPQFWLNLMNETFTLPRVVLKGAF